MRIHTIILAFLRHRLFASVLTALSVSAGVGLASFLLIISIESEHTFSQKDTGYEIIVGAKGSPLQLVLNTMYHIGTPTGNISLDVYERFKKDRRVKSLLPMVFGDNVGGYKVIGTSPDFFSTFQYRKDRSVQIQQGRAFAHEFEVVIGSESAHGLGVRCGDSVIVRHGLSTDDAGAHNHGKMPIVGILAPTGTAIDRGVYMTMRTVWDIHYHEYQQQQEQAEQALQSAEQAQSSTPSSSPKKKDPEGNHQDHHESDDHNHAHHQIPQDFTTVTAIAVKLGSPIFFESFVRSVNEGTSAQAALPVFEMMNLFAIVGNINGVLFAVAGLTIIIGALSIVAALYNSLNERKREIAIMRSLGAHRKTIVMLILSEAGSIGFFGAILGVLSAHILAIVLRPYIAQRIGASIEVQLWYPQVWLLVVYVLLFTLCIACIPAWKAYRTAVADHLNPQ